MVSCLCLYLLQVKQVDRLFVAVAVAPAFVAVAVAPASVAPAVDVRVSAAAVAAVEPAALAQVVPHEVQALVAPGLRHARHVAVLVSRVAPAVLPEAHWPGAQPASVGRVTAAAAGVPAGAAAAQRDVLHVVPDVFLDRGLAAAQHAAVVELEEPELEPVAPSVVVVHHVPVAHHAPGTSVPSHDPAHCSRASASRDRAGTLARPESCW